jgi:hypothetical protein
MLPNSFIRNLKRLMKVESALKKVESELSPVVWPAAFNMVELQKANPAYTKLQLQQALGKAMSKRKRC